MNGKFIFENRVDWLQIDKFTNNNNFENKQNEEGDLGKLCVPVHMANENALKLNRLFLPSLTILDEDIMW